ncbi:MAG: NTP transferase domain-containing protein, partial [bacterium]
MNDSSAAAQKASFPAAILAGGKSARMGRDKSFLPIRGVPVISLVDGVLQEYFSEVFVISNEAARFEPLGLRVVADV